MDFKRENLKITNYCAQIDFQCNFDLNKIFKTKYKFIQNKKYSPKRFSALCCKYKDTRISALIFKNGKINILGSKTHREIEKFIRVLRKSLIRYKPYKCAKYKIYNICTSIKLQQKLKLEVIYSFVKSPICFYEPELFAGMIMTINNSKFTIHRSGVIFNTGGTDLNIIWENYEQIFNIINKSIEQNTNINNAIN